MNKTFAPLCTTLALSLMLAGPATAQTTGGAGGTTSSGTATTASGPAANAGRASGVARSDAGFLKQAAQNGLAEIESSRVALTKAQSAQVKAFAQQMIDDHTKVHDELKALAKAKGVELPDEPSMMQKGKLKLLSARDGAKFDAHYAEAMGVKAHEDTLKLFREASRDSKDNDVRAFAAKTVPALEHHLQMARDLKAATDKAADKR